MPNPEMTKLLQQYAAQTMTGPAVDRENEKSKVLPPEYAMAQWWRSQAPMLSDQKAWEMGQATLDLARRNSGDAPTSDQAAARQLALGLYLHHSDPTNNAYPTMQSLLGKAAAFGPQPAAFGSPDTATYAPAGPTPATKRRKHIGGTTHDEDEDY